MSKLKRGEVVYLAKEYESVTENGPRKYVVLEREKKRSADGKRSEVRYQIRPVGDDRFETFKIVSRKEIVRVPKKDKEPSWKTSIHKSYDMGGGYTLTLAAVPAFDRNAHIGGYFHDGGFSKPGLYTLSIGHSICVPEDEFSEKSGTKAALHRALNEPIVKLYSANKNEFGPETAEALLDAKAKWVIRKRALFIKSERPQWLNDIIDKKKKKDAGETNEAPNAPLAV